MQKRLYRNRTNKMLAGVCAGIADYFGLDPTLVRLAWALFAAAGGSGLVFYLVCAVIIPEEPAGF